MAEYVLIEKNKLVSLADAIRETTGTSDEMTLNEMILALGGTIIPDEPDSPDVPVGDKVVTANYMLTDGTYSWDTVEFRYTEGETWAEVAARQPEDINVHASNDCIYLNRDGYRFEDLDGNYDRNGREPLQEYSGELYEWSAVHGSDLVRPPKDGFSYTFLPE